jgi:hypothetical protein
MAIARDSHVISAQTASNALTYSHTCTGSNLVLTVFAYVESSSTITGITYNGVSMSLVTSTSVGSVSMYGFILTNPATGTHSVVVTSSAVGFISSGSISYTGANPTGQPDAYNKNSSSSLSTITTTVTTVTANDWIAGFFVQDNGGTFSGTNAFTLLQQGTGSPSSGSWNGNATLDTNGAIGTAGATVVGASTTGGTNNALIIGIAIKPLASTYQGIPPGFF